MTSGLASLTVAYWAVTILMSIHRSPQRRKYIPLREEAAWAVLLYVAVALGFAGGNLLVRLI